MGQNQVVSVQANMPGTEGRALESSFPWQLFFTLFESQILEICDKRCVITWVVKSSSPMNENATKIHERNN